ncbi:MAG: hypothetical protein ABSG37_13340, partial [Candidatus Limnocylindrales bacterium]
MEGGSWSTWGQFCGRLEPLTYVGLSTTRLVTIALYEKEPAVNEVPASLGGAQGCFKARRAGGTIEQRSS